MRGDRPDPLHLILGIGLFTPHARGSTVFVKLLSWGFVVYPACAGIDHFIIPQPRVKVSLPRMRGDRPLLLYQRQVLQLFTPHARGSTHLSSPWLFWGAVYPACAGIDPIFRNSWSSEISLPRMRGDRPSVFLVRCAHEMFTPHARGSTCFVDRYLQHF